MLVDLIPGSLACTQNVIDFCRVDQAIVFTYLLDADLATCLLLSLLYTIGFMHYTAQGHPCPVI